MADDIDIEEHDVMDNPAIKNMFPDLSVVKEELLGFGTEELLKPIKKDLTESPEKCLPDIGHSTFVPAPEVMVKHQPIVMSTQLDKEYKPKILCMEDDKPVIDICDDSNDSNPQFFGNKIILGRKRSSNPTSTYSEYLEMNKKPKKDPEMEKCLGVKVVAVDWGAVLKKNKAYCLQCKILFPSTKAHYEHRMTTHVNRKPTHVKDDEVNITNKPTHVNNHENIIANKPTHVKDDEVDITNEIYDGHRFKCHICPQSVTRLTNLRRHYHLKHKREIPKEILSKYKQSKHKKPATPTTETLQQINESAVEKSVKKYMTSVMTMTKETAGKQKKPSGSVNKKKPPGSLNKENLCNHCDNTFLTKEELISHLYNILDTKTFQCTECDRQFDDQENLDKHSFEHNEVDDIESKVSKPRRTRKRKLTEDDNSQDSVIIIAQDNDQTNKKKNKTSDELGNISNTTQFDQVDKSVDLLSKVFPTSTLFKCPKCCLHFASYTSVLFHESTCRKTKRTGKYQCKDCTITFDGELSWNIHKKQHLHTSEFNIIPVRYDIDLTRKILCHCPKCGVHYSEETFWNHFERCEEDVPKSYYCNKCDKLIHGDIKSIHSASHHDKNSKNIIVIDFETVEEDIPNGRNKRKRKKTDDYGDGDVEMVEESKSVEESISETDVTNSINPSDFCYCNTCNCYIPAIYNRQVAFHRNHKCKNINPRNKCICKQCGLMMTMKHLLKHKSRHENENNFAIYDCKFFDLNWDAVNPPLPRFNYCGESKVFYIPLKVGRHVCDRDCGNVAYCKKCDCTYSELAFKLHNNFHAYAEANSSDKFDDISGDGTKYVRYNKKYFGKRKCLFSPEDAKEEECDKEELRRLKVTFWQRNIRLLYTLFKCSDCDAMMTEHNVVSHKNIKYNCGALKGKYKKCEECDFAIAGKDLKHHLFYHRKNPNFNRDQIQIIPFEKSTVVDVDKIETISEAELNSSDDDDGLMERKHVFYQCRNCGCNFIRGADKLKYHKCYLSSKVKKFKTRKPCPLCGLQVNTITLARHFEWHEQNPKATHANLKIIKFGRTDGDIEQPKLFKLSSTNSDQEKVKEVKKSKDKEISTADKDEELQIEKITSEILYQCNKCKLNYYNGNVIKDHACEKKIPYRCLVCRHTFDKVEYERHLLFHTDPNFKRANVKVILFDKNRKLGNLGKKTDMPINNAATSQTNAATIETNTASHSNDNQITVKHETNKETDGQVEMIYKCSCGLHFLTKEAGEDHSKMCGPKLRVAKQNCTKCHLLFTPKVLFDHLMTHHGNKKTEFKYKIIEISEDLETRDTLFSCADCKLLFVEKSTINGHIPRCGKKKYANINAKKCPHCGLEFYIQDVSLHEMKHHNKTNLEAKDFDIITLDKEDYITAEDTETRDSSETQVDTEIDDKGNEVEKTDAKRCEPVSIGPSNYTNVLFKCKKCNLCYLNFRTLQIHIEKNKHLHSPKKTCDVCEYNFTEASLLKHKEVHHDTMNLGRNDLIIQYNQPAGEPVWESFKLTGELKSKMDHNKKYGNVLFRCTECDIYFMLENSACHHVKSYHLSFKTTKQCNICKLNFSLNSLARHNYLHHEKQNLKLEDIEIVEYPYKKEDGTVVFTKEKPSNKWNVSDETLRNIMLNKFSNKVYQCQKCDVNFVTKAALESHINTQKHKYLTLKSECDECGLKFLEPSLARHKYIHHENMNCQLGDLEIVTELLPPQRRGKRKVVQPKLYRCKPCNNCYMSFETCKRHTAGNHEAIEPDKILTCDICNLNFSKKSLLKHKQLHHVENKFTIEDFIVEEFEPKTDCVGRYRDP